MSRDDFDARHTAMDKNLADSYWQLDDHCLTMDKQFASINAMLNSRFDDIDAKLQQLLHQCHRLKSRSLRSSHYNHGVTMSAIDTLTLKSMVQTINKILIAYVRGRNLPHTRMRATYKLRARVIHHMS
jgi:hypothetical protein